MTSPAIISFITGLHLAILQFGYFFLLLTNVTSTYITYATVVVAWMAGSVAGLVWKRFGPLALFVAGVLSYYAVYGFVIVAPLARFSLPMAAVGVTITGMWAGRFFAVMLARFGAVDRLFFHENNGFLVGVIGVFVGFTMLGKPFLFWAPAVSGVIAVLSMIRAIRPASSASGAEAPAVTDA